MNKNLLMSYDEYSKIKHKTPYFYTFRSKDQLLYYFGSNHSNDPNHPQFSLLKEKWKEFAIETDGKKKAVIIEARELSKKWTTLKESIIERGEVGAGTYLADESGSLLVFGEPDARSMKLIYKKGEQPRSCSPLFYDYEIIKIYEN